MIRKENRLCYLHFRNKEDLVLFFNENADLIREAIIDMKGTISTIDSITTENEEKAEELEKRYEEFFNQPAHYYRVFY